MKPIKKPTYQELEKQIRTLKKRVKESTLVIDRQRNSVFSPLADIYHVIELIYDTNGVATDFYYREVNAALEKYTGKTSHQLINKRAKNLFGVIEDYWIQNFSEVIKTGKPTIFEHFSSALGKHLNIFVWKVEANKVAIIFNDRTNRGLSERNLIRSKDHKYQILFDSMTEMMETIELIYDTNGAPIDYYIRDINKAAANYFGKSKNEIIDKKNSSLNKNPECSLLTTFASVHKTGIPNTFENYMVNHNTYFKGSVWKISKNRVGISYRDITETKRHKKEKHDAKIKLKNTQRKLNEAQKLAHIGSWLFNPSNKKMEWSEEMFNIWGFDSNKETPHFDKAFKRIHPDDLERCNTAFNKAANLGTSYNIVLRICMPNGEQKMLRAICKPLLDANGLVLSLMGTNQDITAQKQHEKDKLEAKIKLKNTQRKLNEAQKLAHIGSWLFNPSKQKMEWSEEMFNIWGFDSTKGTPQYDIIYKRIHLDDLEHYNRALDKAANLGTSYSIEFRIYISKEEQKVIRSICKPILDVKGTVISLSGSNQDITAQKLFEEAQVKHQRLKAIGEMSAAIAHDFNNSLQQMMGNLEVVKLQNVFSAPTLARLNNIGSIIGDAAERVSALQKFGDTSQNNKNTIKINFNRLIEESLDQSRPLWKDGMEKKGLKINVCTDFEDIPKIRCNMGELKLAIYNIIKNSIEAMPEGGDFTIKTWVKAEEVFASFTDTGIGMDAAAKLKIFEPFYSTKGLELGRGLGMSGAFSTVKKHKGKIMVKSSKISRGTTIEISFPISK